MYLLTVSKGLAVVHTAGLAISVLIYVDCFAPEAPFCFLLGGFVPRHIYMEVQVEILGSRDVRRVC